MKVKLKLVTGAVVAAVVLASVIFFAYVRLDDRGMLAMLPQPREGCPYLLTDTKGGVPDALSALLTDGVYALLAEGTPRSALLETAAIAEEAAFLIECGDSVEVYSVFRFAQDDAAALKDGRLPDSLSPIFENASVSAGSEKGRFCIEADGLSSPVYYSVRGNNIAMAAEISALRRMEEAAESPKGGFSGKKWNVEESWASHAEISDGGAMTADASHKFTVTAEAAWRSLEPENDTAPAGEIRWALTGLDKAVEAYLASLLKPGAWDISQCVIPEPLLLSAGFSPSLSGDREEWPFPLSSVGETAQNLGLSDAQILEILSGQIVFSIGGQNRILWFTLPGLLAEFTGRQVLMEELVEAFWENLFFGAEPDPLEGCTSGGTTNMPFSVIGAARGETAVLGLTTPQSITAKKNRYGEFLPADEKVLGWVLADLPRIGGALSEMARMGAFLEEEERMDTEPYFDFEDEEDGVQNAEPLPPEMSFSPFDQDISDAFGRVLKRMGRVLLVWETPLSGRINWYDTEKQPAPQQAQ